MWKTAKVMIQVLKFAERSISCSFTSDRWNYSIQSGFPRFSDLNPGGDILGTLKRTIMGNR
jgi:hypothetical protein